MRIALLMLVALASVAAAAVNSNPYQSYPNHEFVNLENLVHRLHFKPAKLTESNFGVVASAVARCERSMDGIFLGTKLSEYLLEAKSNKNSMFRRTINDICPNWVEFFRGWTGKSTSTDESVTEVMALLCIADRGLAADPKFVAVVADFLTRDQNWYANIYGADAVLLLAKRMKKASLNMATNAIRRVSDSLNSDDGELKPLDDGELKPLLEGVVQEVLSKLSAEDLALVPTKINEFGIPVFLKLAWVAIDKLSTRQLKKFGQRMSLLLLAPEWAELFRGKFRRHNVVDREAVRKALDSKVRDQASVFINAVQRRVG